MRVFYNVSIQSVMELDAVRHVSKQFLSRFYTRIARFVFYYEDCYLSVLIRPAQKYLGYKEKSPFPVKGYKLF